ncbi:hypothetical protein MAPG_09002 [Magnaporthiopsis poae ATCC 64411]|uniref:Uncharacterized protein n=1 Tax=Magnaporthiopsis poae (strain ATCC 64411 / 73-15) TaxID=644358 RepID=A0A0C4E8T3_MAGP6|nr:hypothetical protein MAPG_09002 [Magnaporthiopsis poae ATCC 64411]
MAEFGGRASHHSGLPAASHRNVAPPLQDEGSAQKATAGCAKTNGRPTRPLPSHAISTHTIRRTQDAGQLSGLFVNSPQTGEGCLPSNQRLRTWHIGTRLQKSMVARAQFSWSRIARPSVDFGLARAAPRLVGSVSGQSTQSPFPRLAWVGGDMTGRRSSRGSTPQFSIAPAVPARSVEQLEQAAELPGRRKK